MAPTRDAVRGMAADDTAAWNSGNPEPIVAHFAPDGRSIVNRGDPVVGRDALCRLVSGFLGDVPDLTIACNAIQAVGSHAVDLWTLTGHHAETGNALHVDGWEEWDLDEDLKIAVTRGWFDADDDARQVAGG